MNTSAPPEGVAALMSQVCPLPVLKARKRLEALPSGSVLKVVATDPMSMIDLPHFCTEQVHLLLSQEHSNQAFHFRIKRK